MILSSNTAVKPIVPIIQTPPPIAEGQNVSETSENDQNMVDKGNEQSTATQNTAPASSQLTEAKNNASPPPSETASRGAESRVVGNAVPQESAKTTDVSTPATAAAAPTDSDRLEEMRAALDVVTELAENPVSDRMSQLFTAAEANEAAESDSASASTPADDPQSSIRNEQAREGYATTRSLTEDKQAA